MHSEPEERLSTMGNQRRPHWGLIAIAAIIAAALYFYVVKDTATPEQAPAPPPVSVKPQPAELTLPPAPDIPVPAAPPEPAPVEAVPEVKLTLETSDAELRLALSPVSDPDLLDVALASDNLISRCAGVVDSISRGGIPYKALPVKPPAEKFSVVTVEEQQFMDPAGYRRYDVYAKAIAELNTDALVTTFNRFRPLMEQAYAGLGHPAEEFDNAVIRSLDRILATPELHEPIALKRKEAIYQHADAQLEALTEVQKLLLRMGPENIAHIKAQALALRRGLLGTL